MKIFDKVKGKQLTGLSATSKVFGHDAGFASAGGFKPADVVNISDNTRLTNDGLNNHLDSYLEKILELQEALAEQEQKIRKLLDSLHRRAAEPGESTSASLAALNVLSSVWVGFTIS